MSSLTGKPSVGGWGMGDFSAGVGCGLAVVFLGMVEGRAGCGRCKGGVLLMIFWGCFGGVCWGGVRGQD